MSAQQPTFGSNKQLLTLLQAAIFKTAAATTEMRLYQNNFTPGTGTLTGDFTEANFDGYASITVAAYNPVALDPVSGDYFISNATPLVFTDTGNTTPNTIYGWYLTDAGGETIDCGRFDAPVVMDANLKTIELFLKIYLGGTIGPDPFED